VEIGDRDLHQCADAIMLIRAEYFYQKKEYDKISFKFVTGFNAQYSKWMQGYRINPNGKGSYYKKSYVTAKSMPFFKDISFTECEKKHFTWAVEDIIKEFQAIEL